MVKHDNGETIYFLNVELKLKNQAVFGYQVSYVVDYAVFNFNKDLFDGEERIKEKICKLFFKC